MKTNHKWIWIFLITSISLFTLSFFVIDPDYLWHIKAGEEMVRGGILQYDIFSWSVSSSYWMSHEWLFEVVIFLLKSIFGKYHLFVYCFPCIFFIHYLIYIYHKDDYDKNIPFTLLWIFCSFLLCFQIQARPYLFSFLLFEIMIFLLMDYKNHPESKKIYFLPFLGILWSNIHGGSSNLIYLVPCIFLLGNAFHFQTKKIEANRLTSKELKKLFLIIIFCMISVCINIHEIKMFFYPYMNIMNSTMLFNISEWRSTSISEFSHLPYFILLLITVVILLFSNKKIKLLDLLLLGFVMIMGLKSIRLWFYTYIVLSFFIFDYIPKRKEDKGTNIGIIFLSFVFIILFFTRTTIFSNNYSYLLNKEDIQIIKNENPKKIFNFYDYGGDLIYHDLLVFIDGRADLYSPNIYSDYLDIVYLRENSIELMNQYQFDYYLVNLKYPITTYLNHNDSFELIYSRDDIYFYKKKNV